MLQRDNEMDEKTLEALTAIATKLGTTTEYLWGVLLKQAPIAGVIDLILTVAWVAGAFIWYRYVLRKTTPPKATEDKRHQYADWTDEAAFFSWASVALVTVLAAAVVTGTLETTVAALANPEYWALKKIFN